MLPRVKSINFMRLGSHCITDAAAVTNIKCGTMKQVIMQLSDCEHISYHSHFLCIPAAVFRHDNLNYFVQRMSPSVRLIFRPLRLFDLYQGNYSTAV